MSNAKSPFIVVPNFVSPLTCEDIVSTLDFSFPEMDDSGQPLKLVVGNRLLEVRLSDYLDQAAEYTEDYFGTDIKGVHPLMFEWYPEGCKATEPRCENSIYAGGKWSRSNDKDFVGILFLSDYQDRVPFDPSFEVRGGKLQFPNHGFGFNPKRGMLVIFPGSEHFVNNTTKVDVGELNQIRFYMSAHTPYVYNPAQFTGNYEVWFK